MSNPNFKNRTLFHGDNLGFLRGMNSESVHLVATDPPFNKSRDFHATPDSLASGARFQDRWSWRDDIQGDWLLQIQREHPEVWSVTDTAKKVYGDDMAAFLCFMAVRLLEMHRILRQDGSLYLHCDDTASHYLKALLDGIFGWKNFRNDIVWRRATAHNDAKRYGRILDHILFYGKSTSPYWDGWAIATPKTNEELKAAFPMNDALGPVRFSDLTGPSASSGESGRPWRGYDVSARDRHWAPPKNGEYAKYIETHFIPGYRKIEGVHARLDALDAAGLIHHPIKGVWPGLKRYAAADRGTPPQSLILEPTGFTNYSSRKGESVGYPTQKPLAIYERMILASCPDGGIVLDPFCGCATTPIAAERLGRQWVGMDIWDGALNVVKQRMEDNRQLLADPDPQIYYETVPPTRTDSGEEAVLTLRTPTGRARRTYIPPRQQHERLLLDLGAFCQGCGRDYNFDPRVLEVDHIMPRSDGGSDAYENLTLLCPPCNRAKLDRLTLTGLQEQNRRDGHLLDENEGNIVRGRAPRRRRRRR